MGSSSVLISKERARWDKGGALVEYGALGSFTVDGSLALIGDGNEFVKEDSPINGKEGVVAIDAGKVIVGAGQKVGQQNAFVGRRGVGVCLELQVNGQDKFLEGTTGVPPQTGAILFNDFQTRQEG